MYVCVYLFNRFAHSAGPAPKNAGGKNVAYKHESKSSRKSSIPYPKTGKNQPRTVLRDAKIDPGTASGTTNRSWDRLHDYFHMARILEASQDPPKIAFMLIFGYFLGSVGEAKIAKK